MRQGWARGGCHPAARDPRCCTPTPAPHPWGCSAQSRAPGSPWPGRMPWPGRQRSQTCASKRSRRRERGVVAQVAAQPPCRPVAISASIVRVLFWQTKIFWQTKNAAPSHNWRNAANRMGRRRQTGGRRVTLRTLRPSLAHPSAKLGRLIMSRQEPVLPPKNVEPQPLRSWSAHSRRLTARRRCCTPGAPPAGCPGSSQTRWPGP